MILCRLGMLLGNLDPTYEVFVLLIKDFQRPREGSLMGILLALEIKVTGQASYKSWHLPGGGR